MCPNVFWSWVHLKFTIGRTLLFNVTFNITRNIHLNYAAYENQREQLSDGVENELLNTKCVSVLSYLTGLVRMFLFCDKCDVSITDKIYPAPSWTRGVGPGGKNSEFFFSIFGGEGWISGQLWGQRTVGFDLSCTFVLSPLCFKALIRRTRAKYWEILIKTSLKSDRAVRMPVW